MRKTNKSEKNEWHSLGKVRGRACGGTFGGNNLLSWWQPSTAKGCHQSDRKRKKRWGVCIFLEEGNFGFCQALWVLADLFPTLSMIQIKHSFSWGKKKKSICFLVSSHTQEQTYTYQLLLKDGKQSSARSSWFEMVFLLSSLEFKKCANLSPMF